MSELKTFRELFETARQSLGYKVEGAILEFTEQIVDRMKVLGLSKADLAKRIDSSAPYVTKLLRGGTNFTLESMVKVSDSVDCDLQVKVVPKMPVESWLYIIDQKYPIQDRPAQAWVRANNIQATRARENLTFFGPSPLAPQLKFDEHTTLTTW
jgi:transcriptional regulator with XRE-family HTH domain